MDIVLNILLFLVALSFLVMVHEFGHFIFAKIFGVYVFDFSIGMGPAIFSKKGKETSFHLRILPIGGFCLMAGEEYSAEKEKQKEPLEEINSELETNNEVIEPEKTVIIDNNPLPDVPYSRTINGIKAWKKALVLFGGVLFNFILAFILFIPVFAINGVVETEPRINVVENSLFAQNGISKNDYFKEVVNSFYADNEMNDLIITKTTATSNQEEVFNGFSFTVEIMNALYEYENLPTDIYQTLKITLEDRVINLQRTVFDFVLSKEGTTFSLKYDRTKSGEWGAEQLNRKLNFFQSIGTAGKTTWESAGLIFTSLADLFRGKGLENVGGVVAIYQVSSQFSQLGVLPYILFLAMISVNLGVVNLLPIPGLDGSQLLILLIESVSRKKIKDNVKAIINLVGFIFLMGLMVLLLLKDLKVFG
ncbi:MAG: site-2 protease family protein [Bacillales bacterium]|jgi:regulator of sigma E protease|nr:site-2 protease family protein [Bacillales bacterium]